MCTESVLFNIYVYLVNLLCVVFPRCSDKLYSRLLLCMTTMNATDGLLVGLHLLDLLGCQLSSLNIGQGGVAMITDW